MKYFDEIPVIRSIATLLVVCVHVSVTYINTADQDVMVDFLSYINQIARLGTPIFAVISAFLLTSSTLRRGFDLNYFINSRFTKIFIPYLIWTSVYLYYRGVVEVNLNPNIHFMDYYLYGTGNYHLYFILTVIEFYFLFPLLHKIKKGLPLLLTYAFFTVINILWLIYGDNINLSSSILNTFVTSRSFILNWISYFILGIIFAKYYQEIISITKNYKKLLLPIIGVLFISHLMFIDLNNLLTSSHPIYLMYTPFFLVLLIYLYAIIKKTNVLLKVLTLIGNYSMGIYLVHPLIKWIVFKISIFDNRESFFLAGLSYISVVSISILIIWLLMKIPNSNYIVPVPKKSKYVARNNTLSIT